VSYVITSVFGQLEGLSEKEIFRYMGMRQASADGELCVMVHQVLPQFLNNVHCKACYITVPVKITGNIVDMDVLTVESRHLARNLQGCSQAVLFAATVGMDTERQRNRAAVSSPTKALIFDAMGSAAIERFCDQLCGEIALNYSGYRLRPRFSPGYGDFPLNVQKRIVGILDAQRKIGVSALESLLMIPQKSVTAIVGLSDDGCEKNVPSCETCDHLNCDFRL